MNVYFHRAELHLLQKSAIKDASSIEKVKTFFQKATQHFLSLSYNTIKCSLPFTLRQLVVLGERTYEHYQFIKEIFLGPNELVIAGLKKETAKALVNQLETLFNEHNRLYLPDSFINLAILQNSQKKLIHKILQESLSYVPESVLKDITPFQVKTIFDQGYSAAILAYLKKKAANYTSSAAEDYLIKTISASFGGTSAEVDTLLKKTGIIGSSYSDYFFDIKKEDGGQFTLKLHPAGTEHSSFSIDGKEKFSKTFIFSNLSLEEVNKLTKFVYEISLQQGEHLEYKSIDLPFVVQEFLNKTFTEETITTENNQLFGNSSFLSILRQKSAKELFGENKAENEQIFFSLSVAELCLTANKCLANLTSAQNFELISHTKALRNKIFLSLDYPQKSAHLDTLDELSANLTGEISTLLKKDKELKTPSHKNPVIPPILWNLLDQIIPSGNKIFIEKVFQGIELALGKSHFKLIQAIKEEYLLVKGQKKKEEETSLSYDISAFSICSVTQFFLFDLLHLLFKKVITPANILLKLFGVSTPVAINLEIQKAIPEKMWETYQRIWGNILFNFIPPLIHIIYNLYVKESIKEEINYQLAVIDACSFKASYSQKEKEVLEEVLPNQDMPQQIDEIKSRLSTAREKFHEKIAKTLQIEQSKVKPKSEKESYKKSLLAKFNELTFDETVSIGLITIGKESSTGIDAQKEQLLFWETLLQHSLVANNLTPEKVVAFKKLLTDFSQVKTKEDRLTQIEDAPSIQFILPFGYESKEPSIIQKKIQSYLPDILKEESTTTLEAEALVNKGATIISLLKEKANTTIHTIYDRRADAAVTLNKASSGFISFLSGMQSIMPTISTEQIPSVKAAFLNRSSSVFSSFFYKKEKPREHSRIELSQSKYSPLNEKYYFPEGTPSSIKASKEDLIKAFEEIEKINQELLIPTISHPDQLFAFFEEVEKNFIRQTRIVFGLEINSGWDTHLYHFIRKSILLNVEKNLAKAEIFYAPIESPIFSSPDWTAHHTNQLCRLSCKLNMMASVLIDRTDLGRSEQENIDKKLKYTSENLASQYFSKFTFTSTGYLLQANINHLAEQLLSRESPTYKSIHFFLPYLIELNTNYSPFQFSDLEKRTYNRIVEGLPSKFEDLKCLSALSKGCHEILFDPNSFRCLYEEPIDHLIDYLEIGFGFSPLYKPIFTDRGFSIGNFRKTFPESLQRWIESRETLLPQPIHDLSYGVYHLDCKVNAGYTIEKSPSAEFHFGTKRSDHAEIAHQYTFNIDHRPYTVFDPKVLVQKRFRIDWKHKHRLDESMVENVIQILTKLEPKDERGLPVILSDILTTNLFYLENELKENSLLCEKCIHLLKIKSEDLSCKSDSSHLYIYFFIEQIIKKHHPQLSSKIIKWDIDVHTKRSFRLAVQCILYSTAPKEYLMKVPKEQLLLTLFLGRHVHHSEIPDTSKMCFELIKNHFLEIQELSKDLLFIQKAMNYIQELNDHEPIDFDQYRFIGNSDLNEFFFQNRIDPSIRLVFTVERLKVEFLIQEKSSKEEGLDSSRKIIDGQIYHALPIQNQKQVPNLQVAIAISKDKRVVNIHKDNISKIRMDIPDAISDAALSKAILIHEYPYLLFPAEETYRLPPLLYSFSIGKTITSYQDYTLNPYYILEGEQKLTFKGEGKTLKCLSPLNGTVSQNQIIQERESIGNYLVLENDGNRFVIFEKRSLYFNLTLSFSSTFHELLKQNLTSTFALFPQLSHPFSSIGSKEEKLQYDFIPLNKKGYLEPRTLDHFAFILSCAFKKDDDKFSEVINQLIQKIELSEPLDGELSLTKLINIFLVAQKLVGTPSQGRDLLRLAFTYLQTLEINKSDENLQNKALLLILSLPIYLDYFNSEYYKYHPLPAGTEAIFLNELFNLFDLITSPISSLPKKYKLDPFSFTKFLSNGSLFAIIFTLFSDEFRDHLINIDSKYPQSKGLNLLSRSIDLAKKSSETRSTLNLATPSSDIYSSIAKMGIKSLALKALCKIPTDNFNISLTCDWPDHDDFRELDEETARKHFFSFATLLLQDANIYSRWSGSKISIEIIEKQRESLQLKLNSLLIPKTTSFNALRLLQEINRQKINQTLPTIPSEKSKFEIFLQKLQKEVLFSKTRYFKGIKDWGKRTIKVVKRTTVGDKKALTSTVISTAGLFIPNPITYIKKGLYCYDIGTNLVSIAKETRLKREQTTQYISMDSLFKEHEFFHETFTALANLYFEKIERLDRPQAQLSDLPATIDTSIEEYRKDRIDLSYEAFLEEESLKPVFVLKEGIELSNIKRDILALKSALDTEIREFSTQIVKLVNKLSITTITLSDLYTYALEDDAVSVLMEKASCSESTAYLILRRVTQLALYETYLVKTNLILQEIEANDPVNVASRLFEEKHYPFTKENLRFTLACLIFEAKSKVWLRPLQAKQMKKAFDQESASVVIEMIPGSGKTAFGIVLDLHYNWKKGTLPLAIFTKELITSTKKDLAERFYQLTKRNAFFISIDRVNETKASLKHLLHRFKTAQDHGDIIISSKEDLQAIELLYIENLLIYKQSSSTSMESIEATQKIGYLKELLSCIKNSKSVVDECHEILKPDELEKYPISQESKISKEEIFGLEIVFKHLIEVLTKEKIELEQFLKDDETQKLLLEKIFSSLADDNLFLLKEAEKEELIEFISKDSSPSSAFIESHPKKELFAMIRGTINSLLPSIKSDKIQTSYGLSKKDPNQKFVIPYSGNNTPIEGAIFESPHETLFKTYIYYLIEGIQTHQTALAATVQTLINHQSAKYSLAKQETSMALYCKKTFGNSFPSAEDFTTNPSAAALLFVTLEVAPEITFYDTSLESTSMNFSSMLGQTHYFSGTIYNKSVYPMHLEEVRSLDTTARTLDIISKRLKEKGSIESLTRENARKDFIASLIKDDRIMMAMDSAALFNGLSNLSVAQLIAQEFSEKRPLIKAVIFFDQDNQLKALSTSTLEVQPYHSNLYPANERFCYLDQMHTFGVDIPQQEGAGGLITIGQNNLAQIEQSAWRLRGLETLNQFVSFSVMPEAKEFMDKEGIPLTMEGITDYLTRMELNGLKPQTLQAAFHMIKDHTRRLLLSKMISGSESFSIKALKEFEELFIEKTSTLPSEKYGSAKMFENPRLQIEFYKQRYRDKVQSSSLFSYQEKEEIQQFFLSIQPVILPEKIKMDQSDLKPKSLFGTKVKLKIKQKTAIKEEVKEQEKEKELEKQKTSLTATTEKSISGQYVPFTKWGLIDLRSPGESFTTELDLSLLEKPAVPIIELTKLLRSSEDANWEIFSLFLREDLLITDNIIPFSKKLPDKNFGKFCSSIDSLMCSTGPKTWKGLARTILIIFNKEKQLFSTIALSKADHIVWEKRIKDEEENEDFAYALCDIRLGTLIHRQRVAESIREYFETEDFQDLILRFKIFNCESNFTIDEIERFSKIAANIIREGYSASELRVAIESIAKIKQPQDKELLMSKIIFSLISSEKPSTLI